LDRSSKALENQQKWNIVSPLRIDCLTELRFYVPLGDVLQANRLAWCGKTKPNTTKAHIHQSKELYHNTK